MKNKKIKNYAFIIVFIFMLYVPHLSYFFMKDYINLDNVEKRSLSERPTLGIKTITEFSRQWDNYYNDNLPFRKNIINNWRNMHYLLFNESVDNRVMVSKDNEKETWLFYDNINDNDEISFIDGRKKIDYNYLDIIINKINKENKKLKKMGINLYYVIGPNKSSVYSMYLPKQVGVHEDYFFQVYNYMLKNDIDNLFYFYNELIEASKKYETYFRMDTHWNDYGSYIYSKELLKAIYQKDIAGNNYIDSNYVYTDTKNTQNDIHISVANDDKELYELAELIKTKYNKKDLLDFSGLSLKLKDNSINIIYPNMDYIKETMTKIENNPFIIYENEKYKLNETILIVGDSFSASLAKNLSAIYKRVVHFQLNYTNYNEKILYEYKPSKIFYVGVERNTPSSLLFEFIKDKNI